MKSVLFTLFIAISISCFSQIQPGKVIVTGKGNPVLFIPHIGCPPEMWKEVVAKLSKNYACHTIALAGFAGLPAIDSVYSSRYAAFIQHYIESKKLREVTLVGMNYGGFLAIQLSTHPAVRKLVIIDTYPFLAAVLNPKATQKDAEIYSMQMKSGYLAPNDKDFETMIYQNGNAMITNDTLKAKQYAKWVAGSDRKTIATALAEQMSADLRPLLPSIQVPVLIMGTWYFGKNIQEDADRSRL